MGPKSIAPWGDRVWRISSTAQLVEGSSAYWIVTPTQPALHPVSTSVIDVATPHVEAVIDSIIMLLGAHFGEEEVEHLLLESHNITTTETVRDVAPFYELTDDTRRIIGFKLADFLRLGITRLDDFSLLTDEVIMSLRGIGFDIDVYSLSSEHPN